MSGYESYHDPRLQPPEDGEPTAEECRERCVHCAACARAVELMGEDDVADFLGCDSCDQWEPMHLRRATVVRMRERLSALEFAEGGDSHERLSAIAAAVRPSVFGWTLGACEGLRKDLVRLADAALGC